MAYDFLQADTVNGISVIDELPPNKLAVDPKSFYEALPAVTDDCPAFCKIMRWSPWWYRIDGEYGIHD